MYRKSKFYFVKTKSFSSITMLQALRCLEGSELQVCFFIIQIILLKPPDFKTRVNEFVLENSPEHWLQTNWHEKHIAFHQVIG